ncbi:MAG: helix-turn-helix domain-containing protein [Vicinamibacterales bacterium]
MPSPRRVGAAVEQLAGRAERDRLRQDRARPAWRRPPPPSSSNPSRRGSSRRGNSALQLVASGQSNKEIATALEISERTVKSHLAHLFDKLHVTSRNRSRPGGDPARPRARGLTLGSRRTADGCALMWHAYMAAVYAIKYFAPMYP